jgi:hypothetical protein
VVGESLLTSTKVPVLQVPGPEWALIYHEYHRRMLLVPIHLDGLDGLCSIREDRQNIAPIDWKIDTQYEVASGVGVWIGPGATFIAPDLV